MDKLGARDQEGRWYSMDLGDIRSTGQKDLQSRGAFFAAIAAGDTNKVEELLKAGQDANRSIEVSVASLRQESGRWTIGAACAGGEAVHWRWITPILHRRIAAERTPSGKPYIPANCDLGQTTYELTPLMVAYLYGKQNMVKLLKEKGADPETTVVISYFVEGKDEAFSEPWKPEQFAPRANRATGGTRHRRYQKKAQKGRTVRRNRRNVRRTPHKK